MLDPDDPRPPYRQVANHLRAAILTGEFKPGDQLPTGGQLSEMYGVARMTVQKAIQILRKEDLIVSRQGSGVFVKGRATPATGLRPHVEASFEADEVSIDFVGHAGTTLNDALVEPLEKIRRGRYTPELLRIRILVPDTEQPWTLPCRAADRADEPAIRREVAATINQQLLTIVDAVHELEELGLVPSAAAEIRTIGPVQLFELCILNERELFLGLMPIGERLVNLGGVEHRVLDVATKETAMLHQQKPNDDSPADPTYLTEALSWFESIWDMVARPLP